MPIDRSWLVELAEHFEQAEQGMAVLGNFYVKVPRGWHREMATRLRALAEAPKPLVVVDNRLGGDVWYAEGVDVWVVFGASGRAVKQTEDVVPAALRSAVERAKKGEDRWLT